VRDGLKPTAAPDYEPLMVIDEVTDYLRVSEWTVWRPAGRIPSSSPTSNRHIRFDPTRDPWRKYRLVEGEIVEGEVARLPQPAAFCGSRLFLVRKPNDTIAITASGRRGHTVLERELHEQQVRVGDRVAIRFYGMRTTVDGERSYRLYEVAHVDLPEWLS
jgi:hypothetical protein